MRKEYKSLSVSGSIYLLMYLCIFIIFLEISQEFIKEKVIGSEVLTNHAELERWMQEHFPGRIGWFELFGLSNKSIGKKVILIDGNPVIQLENNSLVSVGKESDMNYQLHEMCKLADICDELNVDLLYVNYPGKLRNKDDVEELGYHSYSNYNARYLLGNMEAYGITTLDMREELNKKADYYSWFYKTDHHWTTKAGLLAAQKIAEKLNKDFEYQIDKTLLCEAQFSYEYYSQCWLGETGRRLSKTYSGLDDFTVIRPKYSTSFTYDELKGDFSVLMNENIYKNQNDLYTTSWHYSYLPLGMDAISIHNNNVINGKKILMIKDSYSVVVAPFLALACEEIYFWDVRYLHDLSVMDFVRNNNFDCILVCYVDDIIQRKGMFVFDDSKGDATMVN